MFPIPKADESQPQVFLSDAELAKRWKVSKRTLQRWRKEKRLPEEFRVGRRVLYRLDRVIAFEDSR